MALLIELLREEEVDPTPNALAAGVQKGSDCGGVRFGVGRVDM